MNIKQILGFFKCKKPELAELKYAVREYAYNDGRKEFFAVKAYNNDKFYYLQSIPDTFELSKKDEKYRVNRFSTYEDAVKFIEIYKKYENSITVKTIINHII